MSSDIGELKDKKHQHWPIKREAVIEGDLVLGGLMMVHERSDNLTCGPVMPQGGVQALETMLYTLDIVNKLKLIPGVTLGAHVLDDCDRDTYGLEMAVDFIKGSISNIDDAEYACNATAVRKVISGVVGAASSVTSVQVANLLRLFKIPQVSFFSTSPELSNKARFEYFTRTIPSDLHQVKAMVEIVKQLGWSYVSIIYEESSYGIKAFEELEALLARNGICIAVKEKLAKDSGVATETAYDNIVQKLLTKPRARATSPVVCTRFVCGVWVRHSSTPVVRASGRELSYVLLTGILMCYLVTFALVFRPTDLLCSIQRFGTGFCFTVVYAALLTKTNRISRIFNAGKHSAKRPALISPAAQLAICAALVSVQVLIVVVWMVVSPARAMHHYPTREDNMLVCDSYIDASYMIAFSYPIVLIIICTVYAVLTRKIPEAFNESKHIGFTMYTTCVIWLAFVPLYFGTASHVPLRVTSMAVTISLSASVTLACLFAPKLYIILIRPERNVRQSIMPVRYSRKPPPSQNFTHTQSKKPSSDKETQTDPTDFSIVTNGQTVTLRRVNLDKDETTKLGKENTAEKKTKDNGVKDKDKKLEKRHSKEKLNEKKNSKEKIQDRSQNVKEEKIVSENVKQINNCDITRDKVQSMNEKSESL
ncbi:PREDICTED: metabotropic glutamate receptor-like [Papilio polytes]|uniref:metabotropic glutamate receptor-like n=1 Tax=Papilio polytes TaxID=76194 RepID=UPI0006764EEE|nr:PREDICTED: metabotropic glutamate receptor-like [Papilio polytes]